MWPASWNQHADSRAQRSRGKLVIRRDRCTRSSVIDPRQSCAVERLDEAVCSVLLDGAGSSRRTRLSSSPAAIVQQDADQRQGCVLGVNRIPRKPRFTSSGSRPEWSMWAWLSTTASISAGIKRKRIGVLGFLLIATLDQPAIEQHGGFR